ncbi:DNA polymerase III subunit beta [Arcobacter sp. FWKO B]|uniref:DNA polymerase III subunit beta n=1 Tax=Arcobacter sp. FWKO B TaxID=2593672 RepID=UPI0018A5C82C|nr:DNA polymerase III subunit beta [Arcobacter sp. FWKO B]QOG12275.1 DNA polymerase III subunit beta [Arcobacter sp. FWKO B]
MKLNINKSLFENVISSMQPFLDKKDASSITSHIYLEVTNNSLVVKSTDYEIGLKVIINDINNSSDGKATVNGVNLLGIIRRLKNDDISIQTLQNGQLEIKQSRSNFKLPMYNADEFPQFPKLQELNKLDINIVNLINSMKKIIPSIDNNNPKYELNGALIDIKESKINFVSTDTRRLSVTYLNNTNNSQAQLIIPKKAVIEIGKIFLNNEISVNYDETNLVIHSTNVQFFTKLINGKFPDYQRIIPSSLKYNLMIPKDEFIESIKLVTSLFANIKVSFSNDKIVFESLDEDSEAKTQIDIELNINEDFYIAVNSKYLLDFLSQVNHENFKLGFNSSNLPFYLEDDKFFTIIMPIILEK